MIGEKVHVQMQVLDEIKIKEGDALALPGARISWVDVLCLVSTTKEDQRLLCGLGVHRENLLEDKIHYKSPTKGPEGIQDVVWPMCGSGDERDSPEKSLEENWPKPTECPTSENE